MRPPKKIYAKVENRNNEEVLRFSTSPFLKDNIEYIRKDIAEEGGEWKEYCFLLARSSVFVIVILLAIIACLVWKLYT